MADVLECEVITQLEHIQEILNDVSVEYYSMSPTIFDCCATCSGSCSGDCQGGCAGDCSSGGRDSAR